MMISIMSACLGGLFLLCITFITFLYITARRSRPVSPSPSSCNGVKVMLSSSRMVSVLYHDRS